MAVEELRIEVRLRDLASKELAKIQGGIAGFGRGALGAFRGITNAVFSLKGALVGLGVGLTAKGIVDLIKSTADEADALRDLSIQLGTTTEFLSELKFAGEKTGVELGELEIGLRTLRKGLGEIALTGRGELLPVLEILSPQFRQLVKDGGSLEEVFAQAAKELRALPESERVFAASKLFGRGGGRLLQLLAEDFEKAQEEARKFGITISRDAGEKADAFNDSIVHLQAAFKGLRNQAIIPLLPEIQKLIEEITRFVVENKPKILNFFADFVQGAGEAAQAAKDLFEALRDPLKGGNTIEFLVDQIAKGRKAIEEGIPNAELLRTEVGLLAAYEKELAEITERGRPFADSAKLAADRIREIGDAIAFVGPKFEDTFATYGPTLEQLGATIDATGRVVENLGEKFDAVGADFAAKLDAARASAVRAREAIAEMEDPIAGAAKAVRELQLGFTQWGVAAKEAVLNVAGSLTDNLTDGIMSLIDGTKSFKEAFRDTAKSILTDIARIIVQTLILKAVQGALGGGLGGLFAKGGAFQGGEVIPMASGSIVAGPTTFPMSRGRTGLMGEAGPEAVMPLRRTSSGKLGVEATGGGGGLTVVVNYNVAGNLIGERELFARHQEEIKAAVAQAMRTSPGFRDSMQGRAA